jgi:nitrile hydratase subunit beta
VTEPRFRPGTAVRVRERPARGPFPGHLRTPFYARGRAGRIEGVQGSFPDPERRAFGGDGLPAVPLYLVSFRQGDLWPGYGGRAADSLALDIFEHWLEPAEDSHGP